MHGLGRSVAGATAVLAAASLALAAPAGAASLYDGPAPRPGPDILYSKPAKAPQLRNRGPWQARPILVSGASAYRSGEFLYQDYIYDDHGARGVADPDDPKTESSAFSRANGTYTYPTAEPYADNAADLVELRVKPRRRSTAFRITLNTLTDPELVASTITLGNSPAPRELPHAANATAPARRFLTVHGTEGEIVRARNGEVLKPAPRVRVSKRRNQIDVRVSHRAWNPGRRTVRMSAGVGLWDATAGEYLAPAGSATAGTPGGAAGAGAAFFNAAFRFDEPWPEITDPTQPFAAPRWWRDSAQGSKLASGELGDFHAEVDFAKLASRVRDDMRDQPGGVPTTGPMNRLLSSRFKTGEGADYPGSCGGVEDCDGQLHGRLQPYSIYVPAEGRPPGGYGMTLLLHSLAANYNQFADSNNQSQYGDRGRGSIVITPGGRGPDGWYYGKSGADTFEVWADVARRYRLDADWTAIGGYSMGGYGTYKLAAQYPDLFARAHPTVGPPSLGIWVPPAPPNEPTSQTYDMLESLRHVPFLIWVGANDELVPAPGPLEQSQRFDELGYRYRYDLFTPPADHFALAVHDQWQPAADFLGTHEVDRNPAHVSYVLNPTMDFTGLGTRADHAYWLSGMRLRDRAGEVPRAEIDAISHGFGEGDRAPGSTQSSAGTLAPGTFGAMPFVETSKGWGAAPSAPAKDRLELDLENLRRVVVNVDRARLSCQAKVAATSDGPAKVVLAGCGRTVDVP
ncbi:MAG: alpha/beta hydrolase-fold protein [Solirubrobacterales bacterium]